MKRLRIQISLLLVTLGAVPLLATTPVGAIASPLTKACQTNGAGGTALCQDAKQTGPNKLNGILKTVIDILLLIVGLVAVLFIVIGGMRYVFSAGDAAAAKSAKNTIIYALIGLLLAILSYGIINFVLSRL